MYSPPRGGNLKTDFMNTCKTSKTNQKKKDSTSLNSCMEVKLSELKKIFKLKISHMTKQNKSGKNCTFYNLEMMDVAPANTKILLNSRIRLVGKYTRFAKFFLRVSELPIFYCS